MDKWNKGIEHLVVVPGSNKEKYSKFIQLFTSEQNTLGCHKYENDFDVVDGREIGLLLIDSDKCALGTKIHYAQQAGVKVLFLKYPDD